jgi:hypothetical protein
MALVRCERCGVKPAGHGKFTRTYIHHVLPLGHPKSGIICGTPSCRQPGAIWLEKPEHEAYKKGERIFSLQTNTTKVQAQ